MQPSPVHPPVECGGVMHALDKYKVINRKATVMPSTIKNTASFRLEGGHEQQTTAFSERNKSLSIATLQC